MGLSTDEVSRLQTILEQNRRLGTPESRGALIGPDHPVVGEVREVVESFADEGREVFMAKHVGEHVDWQHQTIGAALHALREEGLVEPATESDATPYRWVIVDRAAETERDTQ